jgi:hypothetical protein
MTKKLVQKPVAATFGPTCLKHIRCTLDMLNPGVFGCTSEMLEVDKHYSSTYHITSEVGRGL